MLRHYDPKTSLENQKIINKIMKTLPPFITNDVIIFAGIDGSLESQLAPSLETKYFSETLGTNHTPEVMYEEFEPYLKNSVFLIAYNHKTKTLEGVARMIIQKNGVSENIKVFDQVIGNEDCQNFFKHKNGRNFEIDDILKHHNIKKGDIICEYSTTATLQNGKNKESKSVNATFFLLLNAMTAISFHLNSAHYVLQTHDKLKRFNTQILKCNSSDVLKLPSYKAFEGDNYYETAYFLNVVKARQDFPHNKSSILNKIVGGAIEISSTGKSNFFALPNLKISTDGYLAENS